MNYDNSFDVNWVNIFYKYNSDNYNFIHNEYNKKSLYGNNNLIKNTNKSMPDGMIEHVFERIWLNVIKKLNANYLILDKKNLLDFYDIKVNAIYFPQFHEIDENNKFWGKGFTEWTLLKPYNDKITIVEEIYDILKPHENIGYYDLNNIETLKKQINIANEYNINGFVIYHYWFDDNTKILYKPLEYFLSNEINYPFSISWANETWSKRWDGSNNEILIKQRYGDENSMLLHIKYLIPFFKQKNYMKTVNNECLFYIYNIFDIIDYDKMILIWNKELLNHNIKIKIIGTENSFKENHNNFLGENNFIFEPMYSGQYISITSSISYKNIINNYKLNKYKIKNKHLGLPLYWNNVVRRKNLKFNYVEGFNINLLEELLLLLLSEHVNKYSNINNLNEIINKYDNIIIVNAWNEWNEQAVLEPNNINGYENLITINNVIKDL